MTARVSTLALFFLIGLQSFASMAASTATFDDLLTPPAPDAASGLFFANGNSNVYAGVTWESGFAVGGDAFRVAPNDVPPGPLFGIPHSGRYFLWNQGNGVTNDAMLITTTMVLTGAWFGRNEYYGFGGGADQVSIHALGASGVLGSVLFDLPELRPAEPEVLAFVDTSGFANLSGIVGYRIDRREIGTQSGNWVADDFSFVAAASVPLPEPATYALLLAGLVILLAQQRARLSFGAQHVKVEQPGRDQRFGQKTQ